MLETCLRRRKHLNDFLFTDPYRREVNKVKRIETNIVGRYCEHRLLLFYRNVTNLISVRVSISRRFGIFILFSIELFIQY